MTWIHFINKTIIYWFKSLNVSTFVVGDLKKSKADIIVFVGFDPHHDYISNGIGNNMLEYLAHLMEHYFG